MFSSTTISLGLLLAGGLTTTTAAPVRPNGNNHAQSSTSAASTIAQSLVNTYPMTNGLLAPPYWSWISAGMHNSLIHYGHYTGDNQYSAQVSAGMHAQAFSGDFMGPNIPCNDDQLWWGLSAMSQAEFGEASDAPQWLSMAQKVFDSVFARWQSSGSCPTHLGGIGWQISPSANGYNYMNSITNGLAFQLAARLARYTNNQHYVGSAIQIFQWSWELGLIDNTNYSVYDGTHYPECIIKESGLTQWSYNNGVFLYGSAILLDHTSDPKWGTHLDGFISAAQRDFAPGNILTESCDAKGDCNTDQTTFKSHLARWLGQTAALVPSTQGRINPILDASKNALQQGNHGQGAGYDMYRLEITQAGLAKVPRKG